MTTPLIFDIKRYAINDGPGVRITIFFKGCPLSCLWCHNPESQSKTVQKLYTSNRCIGCRECVEVCEEEACLLTPKGIVTDNNLCIICGKCADVCPTSATEMSGKLFSVNELMKEIRKETLMMDKSQGGVTFSGGEPLLFPEFLIELLKKCNEENIHTCVDTTGFAKSETILEVANYTDLFLYDLKLMNPEKHKRYTGVSNKIILQNLKTLAGKGATINIRLPLIKTVNDDDENIIETAKFVASLSGGKKRINILPYHNIASKKYEKLGSHYESGTMDEPDESRINEIIKIFRTYEIPAVIGG